MQRREKMLKGIKPKENVLPAFIFCLNTESCDILTIQLEREHIINLVLTDL